MSLSYVDEKTSSDNPLELLIEIVGANDWTYERSGSDELAVEINGRWCNYRLFFIWQAEIGALHFSCVFETRIHQESFKPIYALLAAINEKLWLGHFDALAHQCSSSVYATVDAYDYQRFGNRRECRLPASAGLGYGWLGYFRCGFSYHESNRNFLFGSRCRNGFSQ